MHPHVHTHSWIRTVTPPPSVPALANGPAWGERGTQRPSSCTHTYTQSPNLHPHPPLVWSNDDAASAQRPIWKTPVQSSTVWLITPSSVTQSQRERQTRGETQWKCKEGLKKWGKRLKWWDKEEKEWVEGDKLRKGRWGRCEVWGRVERWKEREGAEFNVLEYSPRWGFR